METKKNSKEYKEIAKENRKRWEFNEDLKDWQKIEKEFYDILVTNNPNTEIVMAPNRYFPDWDIMMNNNVKFEIKYDRQSAKTGNIAIEVSYKWNPSWIFASEADFVVYKIEDEFRITGVTTLLRKVAKYKRIRWWDNKDSELILMKVKEAKEIFTLYK